MKGLAEMFRVFLSCSDAPSAIQVADLKSWNRFPDVLR